MSKGPGEIERRIADLFAATRDRALSVGEIADNAYQLKGRPPTRAQRLSATRAAHRLLRRMTEAHAKAERIIQQALRDANAAYGRAPREPHYADYQHSYRTYEEAAAVFRRDHDDYRAYQAVLEANPAFQCGNKLREWVNRMGVWVRMLPGLRPGTIRFEHEFWRATEANDKRLYFHPPDVPVRVWAVSVQPAGVVWAEAEIVRITERSVMVRYAGEIARLDRDRLWQAWAVWRGVYFVSGRNGRAAQLLDALWQQRYGHNADGGAPPVMRMPLADAMALLGVPAAYTKADVIAAFRRLAKKLHPDVGGDAEKFQRLVEARDRLLAALGVAAPKAPAFAPKGAHIVYRRVSLGTRSIGSRRLLGR